MIIVDVADSLGESLNAIEAFMLVQDEASAARCSDHLEGEIVELIARLEQYPKMGRGADFYSVTQRRRRHGCSKLSSWLHRLSSLSFGSLFSPPISSCTRVPIRA
jgi:hypothetical protein